MEYIGADEYEGGVGGTGEVKKMRSLLHVLPAARTEKIMRGGGWQIW